jgi:hypothetical protein
MQIIHYTKIAFLINPNVVTPTIQLILPYYICMTH